jgi:hypothetical protein
VVERRMIVSRQKVVFVSAMFQELHIWNLQTKILRAGSDIRLCFFDMYHGEENATL